MVRGDAGEALGDSIYEAPHLRPRRRRVAGRRLRRQGDGARHHEELGALLKAAGFGDDDTAAYTRYGSARALYHFHVDNAASY